MAFYIKPPGGIEKLQSLTVFGRKRLTFLKQILGCECSAAFRRLLDCADTADDSECLIEGTSKDRVSHFLLRLACCQDSEMTSFFVRAETDLFCYRFASMNSTELVRLFKSTYQFLFRLSQCQARNGKLSEGQGGESKCRRTCRNLLQILQGMISDGLAWTDVANRYLDGSGSEVIRVPFQYALSLVASRSVVMERGVALVPPADILKVLASFFEELVSLGMVDARLVVNDIGSGDERMADLLRELRQLYYSGSRLTEIDWTFEGGSVALDDIDELTVCFPPCMQHLHLMLRKKHRLRHFSRLQYTLFLKEVGLPVSEAVRFWQKEYSQPSCNYGDSRGCTHDWKRDGKRYVYSIRHLYGLEGSRINYKAHSCRAIQERSLGHGEEGGCPFSHFDDVHLGNIMSQAGIRSEDDKIRIIGLAQQGRRQAACKAFFRKSVAAGLAHHVESTAQDRDGTNDSRGKVAAEKDVEDVGFEPCNRKKARLDSDGYVAFASDEVGASNANTESSTAGTFETVDGQRSQSLDTVQRHAEDKSFPSSTTKMILSKEQLLMHHGSGFKTVIQSPGNFHSDAQSGCSQTGESPNPDTAKEHHCISPWLQEMEDNSRTAGRSTRDTKSELRKRFRGGPLSSVRRESETSSEHQTASSKAALRSHRDSPDDDVPVSSPIAVLRDVEIHKPIDYYSSYMQLLSSLQQLD
ncbi:probable DNA primase large subunit [Acanthaster planci]|uniref:Probable DNA primase large subunit n=1 Tax=Acanthaster planci TaxID=133434 RepID=A0A8B7ZEA8_ACAPL|nr:probable DNA primase large subunit [Acanthaster planci]